MLFIFKCFLLSGSRGNYTPSPPILLYGRTIKKTFFCTSFYKKKIRGKAEKRELITQRIFAYNLNWIELKLNMCNVMSKFYKLMPDIPSLWKNKVNSPSDGFSSVEHRLFTNKQLLLKRKKLWYILNKKIIRILLFCL